MNFHRHLNIAMLASLAAWCGHTASAAEQAADTHAIVGTVGPFGASIGYGHRFGDVADGRLGARLLLNSGGLGHLSRHADLSGNRYATEVKTGAGLSALLDYHLSLDSGWRLTGGVILSRVKSDLAGQPDAQGRYDLHGHGYGAAQVGALTGRLTHGPALVYLGGGWESATAGNKGWRFVSDAGVFVSDRAKVTLTSTNAASNPALQSDLDAERRDLRKPGLGLVLQLGAAYAF